MPYHQSVRVSLCLIAVCRLLIGIECWGQETPVAQLRPSERTARFLQLAAEFKEAEITQFQDEVLVAEKSIKSFTDELLDKRKWRIGPIAVKGKFTSLEEKRDELTRLTEELESAKQQHERAVATLAECKKTGLPLFLFGDKETGQPSMIPSFGDFNVGDFGTFDDFICEVVQISDADQMLVQVGKPRVPPPPLNRAIDVGSVEDAAVRSQLQSGRVQTRRAGLAGPPQTVCVKGVPTKGFADGKRISLEGVFEVTGTRRVMGTQTVYVLEPVDTAEVNRLAPKPQVPAESPKAVESSQKKPKEITIKNGKAKAGN